LPPEIVHVTGPGTAAASAESLSEGTSPDASALGSTLALLASASRRAELLFVLLHAGEVIAAIANAAISTGSRRIT
jgi:hypothetical protein